MKPIALINTLVLAFALGAGGALAAPAKSVAAASQAAIQSTTVLQKVLVTTDAQGVQHRQVGKPDKVVPGDELVYSFPTHNVGKLPATSVVITNAIPEHMVYVPGSAEGAGADISFSVDGGKSWGQPGELKVRNSDGTEGLAQAKDYTNIRWVIKEIAAGATAVVSYHAVLQ